MGGVIYLGPIAVRMIICFCNSLSLSGIATGTSIGLYACFFAGCCFGNCTAVPGVACSFFLGTNSTSVLMGGVIYLGPIPVAVLADYSHFTRACRKAVFVIVRIIGVNELQSNSTVADLGIVQDFKGKGGYCTCLGVVGCCSTVYPRNGVGGAVASVQLCANQQARI